MYINHFVLCWICKVTDIEGEAVRLDGSPVTSSHGFGDGDEDHFQGSLICLSSSQLKTLANVSLSLAHSTRGGFYWIIQGVSNSDLPAPPFLLTNNKKLKPSFVGPVRMHPSEQWAELNDRNFGPDFFCLKCDDWFGVLTFDAQQSTSSGSLVAFSESGKMGITASKAVFFAESPETEFGRLELLT